MRRKLIAGAALLALLMNSPNVSAVEDVVIFGGEFEDDKPAPKPVEKPEPIREIPPPIETPVEPPAPVVEKPEPIETPEPINRPEPQPQPIDEPQPEPEPQPVNEPEPQPQPIDEPQPQPVNEPEPQPIDEPQIEEVSDDDDLGDTLIFDDIPHQTSEPVTKPEPQPVDEPFKNPKPEPVKEPQPVDEPVIEPRPVEKPRTSQRTEPARQSDTSPKNLKQLKQRFIKLAVDETYTYYLDKTSVQWKKMPYSTTEYMADFWIRMIEREPQNSDGDFYGEDDSSLEILTAREKGYRYRPEDEAILRQQSYVLEHYCLRPKTKQIQFLCELEVFGRPQNTINERAYDYRNWENLVPGSVESAIYYSVVQVLDLTKDNPKGHMTVTDMLDEYLRISL